MTKTIPLTKGKHALVDDEDYERLAKHSWYLQSEGYAKGYVRTSEHGPGHHVFMHREILQVPAGVRVDHINGNRLDNRRCNLRHATHAQNLRNRGKPRNNKSGYKGVSWHKAARKWEACINVDGQKKYLGVFPTREQAAAAHDAAAREYHGEFAWTNSQEA